jgi:Rieske Fe-S protein
MPRLKKSKSKSKNSVKKNSVKKKSNSKSNTNQTCPPNMEKVNTNEGTLCVGRCPHSGGPIYYNPKLDKLVCKWHGAQFSKSGKVLAPPAQSNLKVKKL